MLPICEPWSPPVQVLLTIKKGLFTLRKIYYAYICMRVKSSLFEGIYKFLWLDETFMDQLAHSLPVKRITFNP